MKKIIFIILAMLLFLVASTLPGQAWHGDGHFRGGIWIGPGWGAGWGPGWGPGWWGPSYYDPYYQYYAPPPAVIQQPQGYVEPAPQPEEQSYWYFCTNPQGYYPYVKKCPKGWMKVVPPSAPPDYEPNGDYSPAPQDQRR